MLRYFRRTHIIKMYSLVLICSQSCRSRAVVILSDQLIARDVYSDDDTDGAKALSQMRCNKDIFLFPVKDERQPQLGKEYRNVADYSKHRCKYVWPKNSIMTLCMLLIVIISHVNAVVNINLFTFQRSSLERNDKTRSQDTKFQSGW